MEAFRAWGDKKVEEIMGMEDELVSGLCISELEESDEKGPDPRRLQITLTGKTISDFRLFGRENWKIYGGAVEVVVGGAREREWDCKFELNG